MSVYGRRAARVNMSENGSSSDELDERWQKILEQQVKAQQERKTGQRRRASRRAEEKRPSYKLPEIVVLQDCGGWRKWSLVFTPKAGPVGVLVLWDDYTCERRIIP